MATWSPTVQQVAVHLPQRFGTDGPDEHTIPTADQVQTMIGLRVSEVRQKCGRIDESPAQIQDYATDVTAVGTAAYIEASFFPEQGPSETAIFLRRRYEEQVKALRRSVLHAWLGDRYDHG